MWEEHNTDSPGGSYFKAALALRVGRGNSMPNDVLRTIERRIAAEKRNAADLLEPIQEGLIHEQGLGLVKRLSMMRIMARRTKAATVLA